MVMMSRFMLPIGFFRRSNRGQGHNTSVDPQSKRGQTAHLALGRHVLRGKHGRVRGGLVTVGLHLHAARHAGQRLAPRQVRHVL